MIPTAVLIRKLLKAIPGIASVVFSVAAGWTADSEPNVSLAEEEHADLPDARTRWFLEGRVGVDGKLIPKDARVRALRQVKATIASGLLGAETALVPGSFWSAIGPSSVLAGTSVFAGRVTSLASVPRERKRTILLRNGSRRRPFRSSWALAVADGGVSVTIARSGRAP